MKKILSLKQAYVPFFFLSLFFHSFCASNQVLKPRLDPSSQKFLDIIRYIITPQEEKIYREMPTEDRAEFITDFWKRRDPTPETEINEFRNQYYSRLAIADKAFRAGIPGWMTDRGRIFILLGPPTDIIRKSMGEHTTELSKTGRDLSSDLLEEGTRTERPTEIWVYNQYPDYFSGPMRLVFVDYESTGNYKLTTDVEVKPFSMMTYVQSDPNVAKFQWIGQVVADVAQGKILPFLDYEKSLGKIEKTHAGKKTVECLFRIPIGAINYREKNGAYEYDLELSIEVVNDNLQPTPREKKELRDTLSLENLREKIGEGLFLAETFVVPLEKGINKIYFSVRDNVVQKRLRKLEVIKIRD